MCSSDLGRSNSSWSLASGEIDYHTVVAPAVTAALRGIPVRVVACFTPGLTTAIIARPDIKTMLELKGKMGSDLGVNPAAHTASSQNDILQALISLGYSDKDASLALKQLPTDIGVSDGIKQALKALAR